MDLAEYEKLKDGLEALKKKQALAEGGLQNVLKTLKEQFDCPSLDDAIALLQKKEKKYASLEKQFTRKLDELKQKCKGLFEAVEETDATGKSDIPNSKRTSKNHRVKTRNRRATTT